MKPRKHKRLPIDQLKHQTSLDIPDAARLSGFDRRRVIKLCEDGEYLWFWEGSRRRVVTESVFSYRDRQVVLAMGKAS